jgi:hypothetical protein
MKNSNHITRIDFSPSATSAFLKRCSNYEAGKGPKVDASEFPKGSLGLAVVGKNGFIYGLTVEEVFDYGNRFLITINGRARKSGWQRYLNGALRALHFEAILWNSRQPTLSNSNDHCEFL